MVPQIFNVKSLKNMTNHLQELIQERLWLKIFIALFLGIALGILLGPTVGIVNKDIANIIGNWVALPGTIFLALIQMIVIPLVFTSVITGLAASESMEQLRSVGLRVVIFFVATTVVAISIGMGTAFVIQPGQYVDSSLPETTINDNSVPNVDSEVVESPTISELPSMITNILPDNPIGSMVENEMLQIVLFAVVFGIALLTMKKEQAQPLLNLSSSIQEVTMTVVKWAMVLAPFAVFGLIARTTIQMGLDVLLGMIVYVGTVLGGLTLLLLFYIVIVWSISKKSPLQFLKQVREVLLLAFSTSSSAAVMPLSIKTAEEKLHVKSSISQFVIPLGATINMTGTALYQGVATIFLAQVFDVQLSWSALLLVIVTTVGASIGSPATPGVGIVILAMVLTSVGIPAAGVALILGVDRILDMCRTAVNVAGDLTACIVMERQSVKQES